MDQWKDDTNTYYRLAMSDAAQAHAPAEFFAAIYEFAYNETRAEAFDINAVEFSSGLRLRMGFIMHPDYPRKATPGRQSHNDHIHFQLANTR